MSAVGSAQQQADLARLQAQYGMGATAQSATQQQLDQQVQDYLTQQNWNKDQIGWLNAQLRGVPVSTQTVQQAPAPSTAQQLAGLGIAGYGAYKAFGG